MSPVEHLEWSLAFDQDRFPFLLSDLRKFEGPRPVLVEGAGLRPSLIKPLLISARQAIWLIPIEAFIKSNWARSKKRFLAQQTADPWEAKRNLIALDQLLAERLAAEVWANDLRSLAIDGSRSPAEVYDLLSNYFAPHLPSAG